MSLSVHSALSSPDLTALAGAATPRWYLSVVNSSDNATALINETTFTYPLAQLTVDTTSAAWSSVGAGMTVKIGTNYYRVRKAGNATTLYIAETSAGDLGLLTEGVRLASFANNNAITVYLRRRDIWSVIPRIIAASGTIYEDYDATVGSSNTTPDCIPNITMNSTDRRAGFVDAGQTYRTVQFDVAEDLWPTSASIATRLWTPPAAWGAATAGSASSASVTYQVPRSAENYEIMYQATDNNGIVTTAYRQIWAHDRTGATAPLTISQISNLTWNENGLQLTVLLNGTTLASVPIGAMVCVWYDPGTCFNGSDVSSAATQFVGWVVRQREVSEPGMASVELEIVGVDGMLSRRGSYSQWFDSNASPTTWQQLPSTLEYVNFLTWWVAWKRARGVVECFNYIRDTHGNLTARLPQWRVEAAGNLLEQMRKIAEGYSCNVGCNPDGTIVVRRRVNMTDYSLRSSIATRCTLDQTRYNTVELPRENYPRSRHVRGEGFFWDGATTQPVPLLSDAPGDAPGQGVGDDTLQSQTVDNQAFLNTITGLYYAYLNNPYPDGTIQIQGFWPVFYPAEMTKTGLYVPASLRPDNNALNINVMVKGVSLREVEPGAWDTVLQIEGETAGVDGVTVLVPVQATTQPDIVPLPDVPLIGDYPELTIPDAGLSTATPAQLTPPRGTIASTGGQYLIAATSTKGYWLKNFITLTRPQYNDVTPSDLGSYLIKAVALSPFFTRTAIPAYLLPYNSGTDKSAIWYAPNVAASSVVWSKGADVSGFYPIARVPNVSGGILIYSPAATGAWSHTFDFTTGQLGWSLLDANGGSSNPWVPTPWGTYAGGTGFQGRDTTRFSGAQATNHLLIGRTDAAYNITSVSITYDLTAGTWDTPGLPGFIEASLAGVVKATQSTASPDTTGTNKTLTLTYTGQIDQIRVYLIDSIDSTAPFTLGTCTIKSLTIAGTGLNPFGGGVGNDTEVRYSTDNGATFGSAHSPGTSGGLLTGFDVQRDGSVQYAAIQGAIAKATTLGGTWSSWYSATGGAQPIAVIIPYFDWSGANQTADSTPDVIVGLDSPDGSSRTLLWIEGDGTTIHDLTPVAGMTFDNPNCITVSYNHHIAVFGLVSGVYKLYTTNDKGSTWLNRGTLTSPTFLRDRRNDDRAATSGTNKGQLFLSSDSNMAYCSTWAAGGGSVAGLFPRTMPTTPIVAFDPLY